MRRIAQVQKAFAGIRRGLSQMGQIVQEGKGVAGKEKACARYSGNVQRNRCSIGGC